MDTSLFHPNFKPEPYWWEGYRPREAVPVDMPSKAEVVIVGAGYAGLSAALELTRAGIVPVVLEAHLLGSGASTRSGGGVGGALSIGRGFTGRRILPEEEIARLRLDAQQAYPLVLSLIKQERIDCGLATHGRFVGAATPSHYRDMHRRAAELNALTHTRSYVVEKRHQHQEIDSDYYFGGMVTEGSATIQPALYYKGLLDACERAGVKFFTRAPVAGLKQTAAGWEVNTPKGQCLAANVLVATNGYTGAVTKPLQRRIIPVASHIIATEQLPPDLVRSLFPNGRMISDSRRVLYYYRASPDGTRVVFGGRARFTDVGESTIAQLLHEAMVERLPQLAKARVEYAWTGLLGFTFDATAHMGELKGLYYAMGCNGSGVAMMTYLGYQSARKIARHNDYACAFDRVAFPSNPLYNGNPWFLPLVGGWFRLRDDFDRAVGKRFG